MRGLAGGKMQLKRLVKNSIDIMKIFAQNIAQILS